MNKELKGELLVLSSIFIGSIFPIIINASAKVFPPILFAALSNLIPALILLPYLFFLTDFRSMLNKKALLYLINISVFIVILPLFFIFIGTKYTSGINTSIFLNTEILFAIVICKIFLKEKLTLNKIAGALIITLGAFAVLYNGRFQFNKGDLLIILGTAFYPLGNIYAKKALEFLKPSQILFARSFFGGLVLLLISILFENVLHMPFQILTLNIKFILINSIFVFLVSKLLWYRGLKLIEVIKATSIIIATPAFSLIFAYIFLHEVPTLYQLIGCILIMIGLAISSVISKKINLDLTKNS